jgi:hypothetical protein
MDRRGTTGGGVLASVRTRFVLGRDFLGEDAGLDLWRGGA